MPKQYKVRTQGYDLVATGPETVEEYDQKAGKPGTCLEDAVDNEIFRGWIPSFWAKAIPALIEKYNFERGVDEKATAKAKERAKTPEAAEKVKPQPEKFSSYMARLEASLGQDKEAHKELEATLKSIAAGIEIDPSPSSREKGPGRENIEKAESLLSLETDVMEAKVSNLLNVVGEFDLERDADSGKPTVDSLARLVKAFVAEQLKAL